MLLFIWVKPIESRLHWLPLVGTCLQSNQLLLQHESRNQSNHGRKPFSWAGLFTFLPWMSQIICWSYEPCLPQRRWMVQLKTKTSMADSFPNCWTKGILFFCFKNVFLIPLWPWRRIEFWGGSCSEVSPLKCWMAIEQAEEAPKKRKAESLDGPDWTSRYCAMAAVTAMKVSWVWDFQIQALACRRKRKQLQFWDVIWDIQPRKVWIPRVLKCGFFFVKEQ